MALRCLVLAFVCCVVNAGDPVCQDGVCDTSANSGQAGSAAAGSLPPVIWMAPFFSSGGYCSEAIAFALSLKKFTSLRILQHGDSFSPDFLQGMSDTMRTELIQLAQAPVRPATSVIVCHSEPGAWYPPKYQTSFCPPPSGSLYKVGRTMFETDRLPDGWPRRLNQMDEIWVPTAFHLDIFERGGVKKEKLHVVGESVDVDRFNPASTSALPLPHVNNYKFKFLSIFKWEDRKGWPFLIDAFLTAFTPADKVALYILTNAYHSDSAFQEAIAAHVRTLDLDDAHRQMVQHVHFLPEKLPDADMPRLYKAADAFAIPSRGEGWGRPHVEAMSMGLPVIATNWSGPTEYLNTRNGYPLRIDGLEAIKDGPFKGHKWAKPSVDHLRELMQHVVQNPEEAVARGVEARKDMVSLFCPDCVTRTVVQRLQAIQRAVERRRKESKEKPPDP